MAIIKIEKRSGNFVIMDNRFLQSGHLSLRARGLLSILLSFPKNWEVRTTYLMQMLPEGRDAIYGAIKELKENGYMVQNVRRENGRFCGGDYTVYETPYNKEISENPGPENPYLASENKVITQSVTELPFTENPDMENQDNALLEQSFEETVTEKPHPGNSYSDNQKQINIKNNKYIFNKTAAAREKLRESESGCVDEKNAAAVCEKKNNCLDDQDQVIDKTLTATQREWVMEEAKYLAQLPHIQRSAEQMVGEMICVLLDPKSFTQAHPDFLKKFNTIRKLAREGRWSTPIVLRNSIDEIKPQKSEREMKLEQIQEEICQLKRDKEHWLTWLKRLKSSPNPKHEENCTRILETCDKKLLNLRQEYIELSEGVALEQSRTLQ